MIGPKPANALGDPLGNFRAFFEYLFRLKNEEPATIFNITGRMWPHKKTDLDQIRAIYFSNRLLPPNTMNCDNVEVQNYEFWKAGFDNATLQNAQSETKLFASNIYWPKFGDWYSSTLAQAKIKRTFWGNLKSAEVSVAILKDSVSINDIVNQGANRITQSALSKIFEMREYGVPISYEKQLSDKQIFLREVLNCEQITIFKLDITENG